MGRTPFTRRSRRITAALTSILLLQLMLLGSVAQRAMPLGSSAAAMPAMPGMDASSERGNASHPCTSHTSGCPTSSGADECATMAACATAVVFAEPMIEAAATPRASADLPEPARIFSILAAAPESPPPRG